MYGWVCVCAGRVRVFVSHRLVGGGKADPVAAEERATLGD